MTSQSEEHPARGIDRRRFLMTLGVTASAAIVAPAAAKAREADEDPWAVLVDTTRCAGCRSCEMACAEANGLPEPDMDETAFQRERNPSESQFTVVNHYETAQGDVYVKRQCMHCRQPACATACLTKAMLKTASGPVVWREKKCMGCRFCMVSCPFDRIGFEYDSANPRIRKCAMCAERLNEGKQPACVENCPAGALTFGRRSKLLEEAHSRILEDPDSYVHHVYGEHEVGGTNWLYLSAVPFEQIGFRMDLGETPYPKLTEGFLYSVPIIFATVPALLLALHHAAKQAAEPAAHEDQDELIKPDSLARA